MREMRRNAALIFLMAIMLIISIDITSAIPPFTPSQFSGGLSVEPLSRDTLKQKTETKFEFHVVNTSTGVPVMNGVICNFHLYDREGNHLTKLTNSTPTDNDYSFIINRDNLSSVGQYNYVIYCNSTNQGGQIERAIDVTASGFPMTVQKAILYVGLLLFLLALLILDILFIPTLPSKDNYDEEGTLISINQLKYVRPVLWVFAYLLLMAILFTAGNVALSYMGERLLGDLFVTISHVMLAIMLPGLVIWFIYIFYNIFQDNELKKHIERGAFD